MDAADKHPEIPARIAFLSRLEISILALHISQLVAEKLFNRTNLLKEILPPQSGQRAIWFLDIGYRFCEQQNSYGQVSCNILAEEAENTDSTL